MNKIELEKQVNIDNFIENQKVIDKEEKPCYGCSYPIEVEENQLRIIWGVDYKDWKSFRADITWQNIRETHYSIHILLLICLGGTLYSLYAFFRALLQGEIFNSVSILIPIFIIAGFLFYMAYSLSGTITLDRLQGTISVRKLCGLKCVTADFFDDDDFCFDTVGTFSHGNHFTLALCFVKANYTFDTGISISINHCDEFKSFLRDYMDRNSSLPRGTAFDPYRQKDYERRKTDGFPSSLYLLKSEDPVIQNYLKLMEEVKRKQKKSES